MDWNGKRLTINVSSGTIITVILFVTLAWLLFYLRDLVLVVLTAIVLASAIEPAVNWFMRYRLPRALAVVLIYLLVLVFIFAVFYFFMPPVLADISGLLGTLPDYLDTIDASNPLKNSSFFGAQSAVQNFSLSELVTGLQASFANVSEGFLRTISVVFGGIFSFVLVIVLSFYFAVQDTGVDDFLRVVTPIKHEAKVLDLWRRSKNKIGKWMQGQIMLSLIVGILVYLGLTILGMKYALVLAIMAAVLELIPVFGSILAAIPAIGLAFVGGGTGLALLVTGFYLIVNQFQANLIYPLVVQKIVGVPPLLVILALIAGAQLAGFLGIILSVPAAAILQELVQDIQKGKRDAAKNGAA
ncbi:MAG TPA: AI-2E family transporter [Candidatus Paceibacterota bacterium]|jgi:predicted PurR-regulated permease PerM